MKLKLEEIETAADANGLESAFQAAKHRRVNAIMTTTTRPFFAERNHIVELAAQYRLSAIYFREDFVEQGGLMSYGADEVEPFKRIAAMIDKILKGAKPADSPVEQSSRFEFVINLKTAKQLGVSIPPDVLARATKIIR